MQNQNQKCKITAEEPQFTVELAQPLKKPDRIVQFTERRQRCRHCFINGKKDVKCLTYCKCCNVSLCVQKDGNCFQLCYSF